MSALELRPYQSQSVESLRDGFRDKHTEKKPCTKCGTTKPHDAFAKRSSANDGRASAKWRASDPERTKEYHKQHREANKRAYSEANARWRLKNVEYDKARTAKWHSENPESSRLSGSNRRANKARSGGRLSKGLAEKLFVLQAGLCPCCRQPLGSDYHLDHIQPLALGGANEDWNIQLLRKTCNLQKKAKHPIDFMQSRGFLL